MSVEHPSAFDGAPPVRFHADGSQSYGPYVASGMPHTPAQDALADSFVSTAEAAANLTGTTAPGMPRPPAQIDADGLAAESRGTGVRNPHARPEDVEEGRRIAVSMMDRAEAKWRHEHGQPHLREHCETCAEEYWSNRLRPVHYLDAAASIRAMADADENAEPPIGGEVNYLLGMRRAAERLESYARDLSDPGEGQ